MEKDWSLIYTADKMYKAELLKEKLEEENIACDIINKKGSALLLGEVEVYVQDNNLERARAIAKEFGV